MPNVAEIHARQPYDWSHREPWLELDMPIEEFRRRLHGIQTELDRRNWDGLLIYGDASNNSDLRYVTGLVLWWGSAVALIGRHGEPIVVTNGLSHGEPMHSNVQTTWVQELRAIGSGNPADLVHSVISAGAERNVRKGSLAVTDFGNLPTVVTEAIRMDWPGMTIHPGDELLKRLRRTKSPHEISLIRKLAHLTSAGMNAAMSAAVVGASESDIAAAAHRACVAGGADRMLFGCFVGTGQRSFMKNIAPRPDRRVKEGELVFIDLGCKFHGYQSDMSRDVVPGGASSETKAMLAACLEAEDAGLRHIRPGVSARSVVEVMRGTIKRRGFSDYDWSICHGFGMDLVEAPSFEPNSTDVLEAGMCFYIEPMIVPSHIGSVCIEDMVLVMPDGCETLTSSPRTLW